MSKVYVIMKDNVKIKTARSLNAAKEIADKELADVFCNNECIYKANGITSSVEEAPITEERSEPETEAEAQEETATKAESAQQEETVETQLESKPQEEKMIEEATTPKSTNSAKTAIREEPEPLLGAALMRPTFAPYRLTALMNVREAPSMTAPKLRTEPKGSVVLVSRIENNWLKIKNGNGFAYILYEKNGVKFAEKIGG